MVTKDGMKEELRVMVLPVTCKGLDENLHITTVAKDETKGRLALSMALEDSAMRAVVSLITVFTMIWILPRRWRTR